MFLKFILALLPIIWLIVAMSILKWPGYRACFMALVVTIVIAVIGWKLSIINTATAALEGICNALWPIIIVILAALFTYNLTLKTGAMEKIKAMLAGVSTDRRILMLLIAFGFGNFMEGMANRCRDSCRYPCRSRIRSDPLNRILPDHQFDAYGLRIRRCSDKHHVQYYRDSVC